MGINLAKLVKTSRYGNRLVGVSCAFRIIMARVTVCLRAACPKQSNIASLTQPHEMPQIVWCNIVGAINLGRRRSREDIDRSSLSLPWSIPLWIRFVYLAAAMYFAYFERNMAVPDNEELAAKHLTSTDVHPTPLITGHQAPQELSRPIHMV